MGGGVTDIGVGGGQQWHEHACWETSGKGSQADINARGENMNQKNTLQFLASWTNIQINTTNTFQGHFQDLSMTFKV